MAPGAGGRQGESRGERWRNLEIWQRADDLARSVYRATRTFPPEELYGLTSQLRRAALSIPTNIVEGCARESDKEFARFLEIAFSSLAETKYLIHFSSSLDYLSKELETELRGKAEELGPRLWAFYLTVKGQTSKTRGETKSRPAVKKETAGLPGS
jgi:four helix bundle protein